MGDTCMGEPRSRHQAAQSFIARTGLFARNAGGAAMAGSSGSEGRRNGKIDPPPQGSTGDDVGQLEMENAELRQRVVEIALEIQKLREKRER